jgi:4-amino-4-deoxy-L-arabinose transferase-like glycosyltransferase
MNEPPANPRTRADLWLLLAFCGFLFFYGLGAFGLLGADEPRYAQVAREMLQRSDWVTPTLLGKPWLEKPVLYYWEAMLSFRAAGVTDWAARVPSAVDAAMLIVAVYFFLRRFRPGSELDGALIAASCAGVVGFARAAATDMPLAACFSIALLAWYAWRESGSRIYLAAFYVFLALATLAKGPVAPALAGVIILLFIALKRDWQAIPGTLWIPGILLYFLVTLPWYVAVQLRNPEFFRVFILEHNLARFSQDAYHHRQPFWFYLPVFLLAMMPWAVVFLAALVERVRLIWSEGKEAYSGTDTDDSWALFLLIWAFVPVLFFSASQSKLPGYILPAVPAGALLVADYLSSRRAGPRAGPSDDHRANDHSSFPLLFAAAHGILCGLLLFGALSAPSIILNHRLLWGTGTLIAAAVGLLFALGMAAALLSRLALRLLRPATMLAVVVSVGLVIRFAGPAIDDAQSARPIAESILSFSHEPVPVALYHLNRLKEYGLEFYLNRAAESYENGPIPQEAHVVVAPQNARAQVAEMVPGRRVSYLTTIPAQKVDLYWVGK